MTRLTSAAVWIGAVALAIGWPRATALGQAVPAVTGGASPATAKLADAWVTIHNDFNWLDTNGQRILTRSGCLCLFGGTWYWYGGNPRGFREQYAYSSPDLVHWTNKGVVLRHEPDANRIDVLYNDKTKQYVMFLKYDSNGAYFAFATADKPEGPFTFRKKILVDDARIGDMSMFKDDDGTAYLCYVSWAVGVNAQHGIYRMSEDYLSLEKRMFLWNTRGREAPHLFKRNGIYHYGTSKTAGIQSSGTSYYTATKLDGPWSLAQPLPTPGSRNSWDSQVDFVFPIQGTAGTIYMYAGDRWLRDAAQGRNGDYVWLPIEFEGDAPLLNYRQCWELNAGTGAWRQFDPARNLAGGKPVIASSEVEGHSAKNLTMPKTFKDYVGAYWESAPADPQWVTVDLGAPTQVNHVILRWNVTAAREFKVQTSADNNSWTDVYTSTTGSSSMLNDETFPSTSARYVRMYATQRAPIPPVRRFRPTTQAATTVPVAAAPAGYSLFDFMVLKD